MNDFLPILSGLAGGVMQGLADKRARELKIAALERQKAQDKATADYRNEALRIQRENAAATGERNAFDDISTQAKALGGNISSVIEGIRTGKLSRRAAADRLKALQGEVEPRIRSFMDYAKNRGLTDIQTLGILQSNLPYGFLPDNNDFSRYIPAPNVADINKEYFDIVQRLSQNPELSRGAVWSPFMGRLQDEYYDQTPEQLKRQFPLAFPSNVEVPVIGQGVAIPKEQFPQLPTGAGNEFVAPDAIYRKVPGKKANEFAVPSLADNISTSLFPQDFYGTPDTYYRFPITKRTEERYPDVPVDPRIAATMGRAEIAAAMAPYDMRLKEGQITDRYLRNALRFGTFSADLAWPVIRNKMAIGNFELAANKHAFDKWKSKAQLDLAAGALGIQGERLNLDKLGKINAFASDFTSSLQSNFNAKQNELASALAQSAMAGLQNSGVDLQTIRRVQRGEGTQQDKDAVMKAYKDNPSKFEIDTRTKAAIKAFNAASRDLRTGLSNYQSIQALNNAFARTYYPGFPLGATPSVDAGEINIPGITNVDDGSDEFDINLPELLEPSEVAPSANKGKTATGNATPTGNAAPGTARATGSPPAPGALGKGTGSLGGKLNARKPVLKPTPKPKQRTGAFDLSGMPGPK